LVKPGGSVVRLVDFLPKNAPMMHRTKSINYGSVFEGEVEIILDPGDRHILKRRDIVVQRGTIHAWRNASTTRSFWFA
jgi:hypothetical protein